MLMLLESANATLLHCKLQFSLYRYLFAMTVDIQLEPGLYIRLLEMNIVCGDPVSYLVSTFVLLRLLLTFVFQVSYPILSAKSIKTQITNRYYIILYFYHLM